MNLNGLVTEGEIVEQFVSYITFITCVKLEALSFYPALSFTMAPNKETKVIKLQNQVTKSTSNIEYAM